MVRFDLPKLRITLLAALLDIVAALSKPALIRQIDRGRDLTLDQLAFGLILAHHGSGIAESSALV